MTLLGKPVPPLDHEPNAWGAPPGIDIDFDYYKAWSNGSIDRSRAWWTTRPQISPIGAVVHTNAASVEASITSSVAHGNRGQNNTKPHYNLNAPRPQKNVPSDRRAIANSTGSSVERTYGCPDSSFWLLAIETADAGGNKAVNGDYGDFLYDHDEILARLLAYESIVGGWELRVPPQFYTEGVYTHTEPWPYPYLTTAPGKTCPTDTKKDRVLRGDIIPRAIEIKAVWTGLAVSNSPLQGDTDMPKQAWPNRIDTRQDDEFHEPLTANEVRPVWISSVSVGMDNAKYAVVNVTVLPKKIGASGFLAIWPGGEYKPEVGNVTTVNWSFSAEVAQSQLVLPLDENGNVFVKASRDVDFIFDITGIYW